MTEHVAFNPAEFVRDFEAAGCPVMLMPVDAQGLQGFCIQSGKGYGTTMMRWADSLDETPDFEQQIIAYLQQEADHGA